MKQTSLFTALLLGLTVSAASAQSGMVSRDDVRFLNQALRGDRAEVQTARFVMQRTSDPVATRLARRMIDDHSMHMRRMMALDQRLGVAPASGIPADAQEEMNRLGSLSPNGVAAEYIRNAVTDHRKDIADYREELATTTSRPIRAMVAQTLPVLNTHLSLAERDETLRGLRPGV